MTLSDIARFASSCRHDEYIWIDGDRMEAWLCRSGKAIIQFKLI